MRMEDVNARRAYIQSVRKSFDAPGREYEWKKEADTKGEAMEGFSFFKARLLIAALLFAAYVFCDRTDRALYHVTMKQISDEIVRDVDYTAVREEVMQVFRAF